MRRFETTREEIVKDLVKIGVEKGDILLVHSSLSSIGYVAGGAETLIDALLESVGEEGTIVVPTITGQIFDSPENPPSYSKDKPCWTGAVPETLRKRGEACRSRHPTHSVAAIGKMARRIVEGHEEAKTPCGKNTPYLKIAELGGKILFIGVSLESNTSFHTVEELAKLYYHLQPEPTCCKIEADEGFIEKRFFLHAYGTPRAFSEKEEELAKQGIARTGYIGRARSILIDAEKLIKFTLGKVEEDRLYLVDKDNVDLWSVSSSISLIQENRLNSVKISLYVPKHANVKFFDKYMAVRGVRMNLSGLNLTEAVLETPLKISRKLELQGGYNYWMKFKNAGQEIEAEVLDFKDSGSLFGF
ncbi:MAG: AAC(3) family N-acetyltransferase [Crenarchaeota archaeon]|nr:AAC(3) family N-acetyltransferase [Thermoproteota archaeon]